MNPTYIINEQLCQDECAGWRDASTVCPKCDKPMCEQCASINPLCIDCANKHAGMDVRDRLIFY